MPKATSELAREPGLFQECARHRQMEQSAPAMLSTHIPDSPLFFPSSAPCLGGLASCLRERAATTVNQALPTFYWDWVLGFGGLGHRFCWEMGGSCPSWSEGARHPLGESDRQAPGISPSSSISSPKSSSCPFVTSLWVPTFLALTCSGSTSLPPAEHFRDPVSGPTHRHLRSKPFL